MISTNDNYAKLQNLFDLHCGLCDFLLKKEDSKEKTTRKEELSPIGPFLINDSGLRCPVPADSQRQDGSRQTGHAVA